jgi:2-hydroxychromene-2-carboxylate isomerase
MSDASELPAAEPAPIGFYFDFISPFGYFASLRIDALAARHGRTVDWRAMLVGVTVLKVMGLKPMMEIPLRGDYLKRDAARYMRRHGIALKRPIDRPPSNPLFAGRAYHWLRVHAPDRARAAAAALYAAYWVEDVPLDTPEGVADIAGLGVAADRQGVLDGLASGEASSLLRQEVEASIARGIFGSPSFLVGDELFFGVEKLELLDEWLATGGW